MQVSFDPSEVAHFFHIRAFLKTFDSAGVKILVVENIRLTQMCYLIKINLRKAILTPKVLKSLFQNIRFTGCDILSKSILRKAILTPEGSNVYRIDNDKQVPDPSGVVCCFMFSKGSVQFTSRHKISSNPFKQIIILKLNLKCIQKG